MIRALLLGIILRLVAAYSGWGWFAPDDHEFGIAQGATWLDNPDSLFTCPFRMPILSYIFLWLMRAANAVGINDKAHVLQFVYMCIGLYSALAIPAVYQLAYRVDAKKSATTAALLMSTYCIMPHISTRGLIEVIAIVPLVWSLVYFNKAIQTHIGYAVVAGFLLSLAIHIRFQLATLGIIFLAYGIRRIYWRHLCCMGIGFVVCVALFKFSVIAAIKNYVVFNATFANTYGTSPWYTYMLHFATFMLPPATFFLIKPLYYACKQYKMITAMIVVFVISHSLIGHKEDRFMFPALALFFVPLGAALQALKQSDKRFDRISWYYFWVVNTVVLCIATTSDAQRNLTMPLLYMNRLQQDIRLATVGYYALPMYYVENSHQHTTETYLSADIDELLYRLEHHVIQPNFILFRHSPAHDNLLKIKAMIHCNDPVIYPGDFVDRILVRMNKHNGRRAPTALMDCRS